MPSSYTEEVKIADIIVIAKNRWRHLVFSSGIGLIISLIVSLSVRPKYEVSLFLNPPSNQDISEVSSGKEILPKFGNLSAIDIYKYFSRELMSEELKKIFFEEIYTPSINNGIFNSNDDSKSIVTGSSTNDVLKVAIKVRPQYDKAIVAASPIGTFDLSHVLSYNVKILAPSSELAEKWTRDFLSRTEDQAKKIFLNDYMGEVTSNLKHIQEDLSSRRFLAQQLRKDREAKLQEALLIARAIPIQGPLSMVTPFQRIDQVTEHVNNNQLYTLGVKALEAELGVLKKRVTDDPFIEDLREAEMLFAKLKRIQHKKISFKMYQMDGNIKQSIKKIEMNVLILLILGLMIGFIIGVLSVILMEMIKNNRTLSGNND
jgi:chain length determinant protein (polysaccharide antigen chain regulator)